MQEPNRQPESWLHEVAGLLAEAMELADRQQAKLPQDGKTAADFADLQRRYFRLIEKTDA